MALLFFAPGAAAQVGEAAKLEEIIISATRTARFAFTTPLAASVRDLSDFEHLQPASYQDLLGGLAGVGIQGGPRRIAEEPNIRGFQDEQVVILRDGARQNFDIAHRGRFFADPDLLGRIEVVRGSASALYGSGALGGVISLRTLGARDVLPDGPGFGMRAKAGYQSNGDELLLSSGVYGRADKLDGLLNVVHREAYSDFEDGDGRPLIDSRDRLLDIIAKIGVAPAEGHRLELIGDLYRLDDSSPTNTEAESTPRTVVGRDSDEANLTLNYSYRPAGSALVDLHAVAYYTDIRIDEDRLFDGRLDRSNFDSKGVDIYNTSELWREASGFLNLTYGLEYFRDRQSGERNGGVRPQFPDAARSFTALYAQAELELWRRLSIIPGLRWDSYKLSAPQDGGASRKENRVTPRVALGFSASDNFYVWGSYAEAFRAPSLTELYADGVHFVAPLAPGQIVINQFVPTPGIRPEKAKSWEVGARLRGQDILTAADRLEVSLSAYRSTLHDMIEQYVVFIAGPPSFTPPAGPLVFPGVTSNRNVDARLEGAELSFRYDAPFWAFNAEGHVIDGDRLVNGGGGLANTPADRLVLGLEVKLPAQALRAGVRLTLAADQKDVPADVLPTAGYEKVDVYLYWAPQSGVFENMTLAAGIDNLLDQAYMVHPTPLPQPGRSFKLSLKYGF